MKKNGIEGSNSPVRAKIGFLRIYTHNVHDRCVVTSRKEVREEQDKGI